MKAGVYPQMSRISQIQNSHPCESVSVRGSPPRSAVEMLTLAIPSYDD